MNKVKNIGNYNIWIGICMMTHTKLPSFGCLYLIEYGVKMLKNVKNKPIS